MKNVEHIRNNCIKFKKVREELTDKLNKLDANTKNKTLLEIIEYYYYSKSYTNKKEENKDDNKGIKLIKEFVETLYKEMTEERNKRK